MPMIKFSASTGYVGRNGWETCVGVNVEKLEWANPPAIAICLINSKGKEASGCSIEVPVEDLESFIELLQRVARE